MKPIDDDFKKKYLHIVKSIVLKESIEETNYSRALANSSQLKDYEIGLTAGRMEAFCELLDEIKELEYHVQYENVKSSDFYPCADENGMVGK